MREKFLAGDIGSLVSLRFPRLQRDAALFFEGTEDLKITGCTIERVDGNAVMLSGYTRGAVIERNEFTYVCRISQSLMDIYKFR